MLSITFSYVTKQVRNMGQKKGYTEPADFL